MAHIYKKYGRNDERVKIAFLFKRPTLPMSHSH